MKVLKKFFNEQLMECVFMARTMPLFAKQLKRTGIWHKQNLEPHSFSTTSFEARNFIERAKVF